ncbi:MAG: hypothetical protein KC468_20015, partial [Myxococcales bacterium]|nr:hypothetical protein [Myxococcales bacterium]
EQPTINMRLRILDFEDPVVARAASDACKENPPDAPADVADADNVWPPTARSSSSSTSSRQRPPATHRIGAAPSGPSLVAATPRPDATTSTRARVIHRAPERGAPRHPLAGSAASS